MKFVLFLFSDQQIRCTTGVVYNLLGRKPACTDLLHICPVNN